MTGTVVCRDGAVYTGSVDTSEAWRVVVYEPRGPVEISRADIERITPGGLEEASRPPAGAA